MRYAISFVFVMIFPPPSLFDISPCRVPLEGIYPSPKTPFLIHHPREEKTKMEKEEKKIFLFFLQPTQDPMATILPR